MTGAGTDPSFLQRLDAVAADVESVLGRLLGAAPVEGERARPERLAQVQAFVASFWDQSLAQIKSSAEIVAAAMSE